MMLQCMHAPEARARSWERRWQGHTVFEGSPQLRMQFVRALADRKAIFSAPKLNAMAKACDEEIERLFADLAGGIYADREAMKAVGEYMQTLRVLRASIMVVLGRHMNSVAVGGLEKVSGFRYPPAMAVIAELKTLELELEMLAGIRYCSVSLPSSSTGVFKYRSFAQQPERYPFAEEIAGYRSIRNDIVQRYGPYDPHHILAMDFQQLETDSPVHQLLGLHFGGRPMLEAGEEGDPDMEAFLGRVDLFVRACNQPLYLRSFSDATQIGVDRVYSRETRRTTFVVYHVPNGWDGEPTSVSFSSGGRLARSIPLPNPGDPAIGMHE